MGDTILRDILIIFAFAIPAVLIAHKLKFPAIVGFILTGFFIGPHAFHVIPDIEEIRLLAEVGVALLLFSIGLEFSFDRLKGWGRSITWMGSIQVALTAAAGFVVAQSLGWNLKESAIFGCAIALSSTAIVMAVLSQKRWFDAPAGRIATGILIFQDLAVIPIMVAIRFMAMPESGDGWSLVGVALAKFALLIFLLYAIARWALKPALLYISRPRSKELFVVVIVGMAIGAAYATEQLELSFALGAFLAGILVSTTDFRFQAISEIAPFRYCFSGLFFVTVGMIVDPTFIANNCISVLLLVAIILIAKVLITGGIIYLFGYSIGVAAITALMVAQVGEFSFMLAFFSSKAGVLSDHIYNLIVDSSAITMVIAPLLVSLAPKIGEILSMNATSPRDRKILASNLDYIHMDGHAIICGFGPLGMTIGRLLDRNEIQYVVLELNPATVDKMRKKGAKILIGDGSSSNILHHSGIERAKLLAIAVPDHLNALAIVKKARIMNADIFIITRSKYRDQVQGLYDAGADVVVCEELEAGIEMGRYILAQLEFPEDEVKKVLDELRAFGSADFF